MVPLAAGGGGERPGRPALRRVGGGRGSGEAQRNAQLTERLRCRRSEIEHSLLARVHAISDPGEVRDPSYAEGLRSSVGAALDYALETIARGEGEAPPPPPALLAQARLAARNGVGLDTVLRRYSAGYVLLSDFLLQEAEGAGIRGPALQRLLRSQAVLDRLFASVSEEYNRELQERPRGGSEQRRTEPVRRLLEGELVDAAELGYDLGGHHLGLLATGPGAGEAIRSLARSLDRRLLLVSPAEETAWAWLGGRQALDPAEALRAASPWPQAALLALGEAGEGIEGWRLSHRQAKAALAVARRGLEPAVRYADVALLGTVLRDELLVTSLRRLYIEPLEVERDGGEVLIETLRAYFAADHNVSSAAASLGVKRETVSNRLRAVERRVDRPLGSCLPELELSLRLNRLDLL